MRDRQATFTCLNDPTSAAIRLVDAIVAAESSFFMPNAPNRHVLQSLTKLFDRVERMYYEPKHQQVIITYTPAFLASKEYILLRRRAHYVSVKFAAWCRG